MLGVAHDELPVSLRVPIRVVGGVVLLCATYSLYVYSTCGYDCGIVSVQEGPAAVLVLVVSIGLLVLIIGAILLGYVIKRIRLMRSRKDA